ncbi:hypothetical protein F4X10_08500 [Candidatus Poribacteria bacterium]|nr:hypothetical protein [Candidatus Poribacteria bacterium]
MKNAQFDVVNLGALISDISSGATPKVDEDYYTDSSGIPFLRVQNVVDEGIDLSDAKFITREVHNGMLKRSQLKKDDLVFTITGRIGSVAVVPDNFEGNINQHSVRFQLKTHVANNAINPRYVAVFLNLSLGQSLAIREVTGGTRPALDYKALYSLRIILPPTNIQNHIVSIMRSAYRQKKQKEQEANTLLDSIDDYMPKALGIERPQEKENSIENRVFTAMLSEVSGRRFDPEMYYQVYSLHTKLYPMEKFQNCVLINPPLSFHGYELDTSITFVPMEKVSAEYGEADLSLCKTIAGAKGYTRFRNNDLIWAKITPCMENGKSAVVDNLNEGIGCGSTEFHVFRALEKINIHYIHALLRLKSLREHAVLHFTGSAGQQRVSSEFFKELIIPKPPIEKQTEIAEYIANARNRAKQLQQEAGTVVEQAKERVERMLLAEA